MRNLYIRLNVAPDASPTEIRAAIAACQNASVRADASEVLLNEARRRTYDRINTTLIDIGHLRASLGLSHADNWRGEESTEYAATSATTASKHSELVEKIKKSNRQVKTQRLLASVREFIIGLFRFAAGLAAVAGIFWFLGVILDRLNSDNSGTHRSPTAARTFNEPVLNLPYSGAIRNHTSAPGLAPFEIRTSEGSNYLVKLVDADLDLDIMDVFVRGGDTIEVAVPLGRYIVKYAAGITWYGYQHYFGPDTGYSKADTVFHFKNDRYQITGYTITLYQVSDGNLSTSQIGPSQF